MIQIDINDIDRAAIKCVQNIMECIWDCMGEEDNFIRIMTLGEINGVLTMAEEMKKALKG